MYVGDMYVGDSVMVVTYQCEVEIHCVSALVHLVQ